jgi:hypothetical protein
MMAKRYGKTLSREQWIEGFRDAALNAFDEYVREVTEHSMSLGARDSDLPELFRAIDAHAMRVAARFNEELSQEPGSANLRVA